MMNTLDNIQLICIQQSSEDVSQSFIRRSVFQCWGLPCSLMHTFLGRADVAGPPVGMDGPFYSSMFWLIITE